MKRYAYPRKSGFCRNSVSSYILIIIGISAVHGGHTPAASGIETINPEHVRDDARFKEPGLKESADDDYDYDLYFAASAFMYEPEKLKSLWFNSKNSCNEPRCGSRFPSGRH